MESFEVLRTKGLLQEGFEGRDITHLFNRNTYISESRSGWDLFQETGGLSPDEYIIAIYTILNYKKIKDLSKYDKVLSKFHMEASKITCRNELDDETSLKYKLIILTSSININHLIRWTPEYDEHRQLLKGLIIDKGASLGDLARYLRAGDTQSDEANFTTPAGLRSINLKELKYLYARTLKDEGYSMDNCSAALYSEWMNIYDVMRNLIIDHHLTLQDIYNLLEFHWPDKINIAMLYFSVKSNIEDLRVTDGEIIEEIKRFINDRSYNVIEMYKSWVQYEYITRENDMKLLSKLLGYQNVIIEYDPFKSTPFIIESFRSVYSLETRAKDGIRMFNRMKVSEGIPFIYYRESGENVFSKVYRGDIRRSILSSSRTAIPGKIYITIWTGGSSLTSYSTATYTIKTNEIELPIIEEIWRTKTIDLLEKTFSSKLIQTKKTKIKGSFYIYSVEFDRSTFLDVVLNDSVFNKYLYVDEITSTLKAHIQLRFTSTMGTATGYKTYDDTSTDWKKSVLKCNVKSVIVHPGGRFLVESSIVENRKPSELTTPISESRTPESKFEAEAEVEFASKILDQSIGGKVITKIVNYESKEGEKMIKFTISDSDNIDIITSFIETMKKLITIYFRYNLKNEYLLLLTTVPEDVPEKYVPQKMTSGRKRRTESGPIKTKLQHLRDLDDILFETGYARSCPPAKQPIPISEAEAKVYRGIPTSIVKREHITSLSSGSLQPLRSLSESRLSVRSSLSSSRLPVRSSLLSSRLPPLRSSLRSLSSSRLPPLRSLSSRLPPLRSRLPPQEIKSTDVEPRSISESKDTAIVYKGNVLKFPNADGGYYYFIGNEKFPFVGVKPNPTDSVDSVDIYPYVPCLYVASQHKTIKDWQEGKIVEGGRKKPSKKVTLSGRILPFLGRGVLLSKLDKLVSVGDEEKDVAYGRLGMLDSKSSFLQCLLEAVRDRRYMNSNDKLKYVNELRVQMGEEINPGVTRQELYDLAETEIREDLKNINVFLDPRLHFRALEELFGVTIYTFIKEGMLEIPRHRIHHIKPFKYRNVVMIYKDGNRCELIFSTNRIYSHKIKPLYSLFLRAHGTYTWSEVSEAGDVDRTKFYLRSDLYTSVYFYGEVLKSYATRQYIDNYGKVRGFLTKVNDTEVFIAVIPSEPVNIPTLNIANFKPPRPDIAEILSMFKHMSPSGINQHGVWYPILDIRYGIFVYAIGGEEGLKVGQLQSQREEEEKKEVRLSPSEMSSKSEIQPRLTSRSRLSSRSRLPPLRSRLPQSRVSPSVIPPDPLGLYKTISILDDKSQLVLDVILQFIDWIYSIYLFDSPFGSIDQFFEAYVSTGGEYEEYDISGIRDYNYLPHDVSINRAIEFISFAVPVLVRDEKLWMYSYEFDIRIRYHLKQTFSMILSKKIPEKIVGLVSFFREDVNTVLIIGDRNLRTWTKDELREDRFSFVIRDKVKPNAIEPYMYGSYLVQNTSSLNESLAIALHWNKYSVNRRYVSLEETIDVDYVIYSEKEGKLVVKNTNFKTSSSSYLEVIRYSFDKFGALLRMF